MKHATNSATVSSFIGRSANDTSEDVNAYSDASPIVHVSGSSPPVLLAHGDSDDTAPYRQSVMLERALRNADVPVKLVELEGVIAFGKTLKECQTELRSTVEDWILVGFHLGHRLPVLDGIDLNKPSQPHVEIVQTP